MFTKPDISIIITSYNTSDILKSCIKSIYKSIDAITYEIICVDDNSDDGSADMVRNNFPEVQLIKNKENLGYAKSNNIGIRISKGRYIVLLNADTEIERRAFDLMAGFMDRTAGAGACSPKLLNPDGSIQHCIRSFPSIFGVLCQSLGLHRLFPNNLITNRYYMKHLNYNQIIEAESIGTTCYMVKREVVEEIGLLDEAFFMYCVDLDLNKRIGLAGYKIFYLPEAKAVHFGGLSVNQNSPRHLIEAHRGFRILFDRYYAPRHSHLYNALIRLAISIRLKLFLMWLKVSRDKRVVKGPGAARHNIAGYASIKEKGR
jgi:GT2 family glycosyltransferase